MVDRRRISKRELDQRETCGMGREGCFMYAVHQKQMIGKRRLKKRNGIKKKKREKKRRVIKIERKNKGNLYAYSKNKRLTKLGWSKEGEKGVIYSVLKKRRLRKDDNWKEYGNDSKLMRCDRRKGRKGWLTRGRQLEEKKEEGILAVYVQKWAVDEKRWWKGEKIMIGGRRIMEGREEGRRRKSYWPVLAMIALVDREKDGWARHRFENV